MADLRDNGRTFMIEIFSGDGHLTIICVQGGHLCGQPLDIRYSIDLKDVAALMQLIEWVARYEPWLVTIAIPCTAYSRLNKYLNAYLWRRFEAQQKAEYVWLELTRDLACIQATGGRLVLVENPNESDAWKKRPLEELQRDPRFVKVTLDQCMVNLRDISWPHSLFRKATGLLVMRNTSMENIGVRCSREHEHSWIIGGKRAKAAGAWTPEFAESIMSNALQEAVRQYVRLRSWLMLSRSHGEIVDQQTLCEV